MPRDELRHAPPAFADCRERRVMLCSPDMALSDHLEDELSRRGYRVERVASAARALVAAAKRAPDLLLCDDAPPVLDAMALLHQLQQPGQPLAAVPVVVLSDFGTPEDIAAGRRAGADDFLAKPVQVDLLDAAIMSQLRLVERVRASAELAPPNPSPASLNAADPSHAAEPAGWAALADRLSFGIIMSGRGGQPLFTNLAARRLAGDSATLLRSWARPQAVAADPDDPMGAPSVGAVTLAILPPSSAPGTPDSPLFVAHVDLRRTPADAPRFATLLFSRDWPRLGTTLMARALGLTRTETAVAAHLAMGTRPEEIAQIMSVTMPTVSYHLRNIYQKSGTSRRVDAVCLLRSIPVASAVLDQLPSARP